jgi:multicomponent Na+:H+ antiporter subunit D
VINHLPILQVIVPLLAAPICLFLKKPKIVWLFACVATAITFLISVLLLQQVNVNGTLVYELGGWEAPWGIEYRIDYLNALLLLIISSIGAVVLWAAHTSLSKELNADRHLYFYVLYLLSIAGMLGIVATGDAFNVFVFLEVSSLSAYALIALGRDRRALWASYKYLIMGTIGATFILIGIGLMYQMTGTLNMHDLATRLPEVSQTRPVFVSFAFIVVGVCLKLALFPLHLWLPNAYAYAPSIVTALLAATSTKVAIYLLIRFTFSVYGLSFSFTTLPLNVLFLVLGVLGVFVASVAAIYRSNVKRLFAYSSVAQVGYMIIGFSVGTAAGLSASLIHIFNHALMKASIFLALGAVMYRVGSVSLSQMNGLGREMPYTMAAIVIGGLSLIGVPLTVGFISKWYLIVALLDNGWWPVALLVLLGSLLAVIYVWKVVECAYFKPADSNREPVKEAPMGFLIPVWVLVLANIYFGLDTRLSVGVAQAAASGLFGAAP